MKKIKATKEQMKAVEEWWLSERKKEYMCFHGLHNLFEMEKEEWEIERDKAESYIKIDVRESHRDDGWKMREHYKRCINLLLEKIKKLEEKHDESV